ncbi:hypothetical protein TNCV_433801 [Trichonephila clavipes]|nr:hypothetical protein TNCV_433801 [Trichonephila clavipes]
MRDCLLYECEGLSLPQYECLKFGRNMLLFQRNGDRYFINQCHWAPKGPYKLDLTRFSGYKFRFASAKGSLDLQSPGPEISRNRHCHQP